MTAGEWSKSASSNRWVARERETGEKELAFEAKQCLESGRKPAGK